MKPTARRKWKARKLRAHAHMVPGIPLPKEIVFAINGKVYVRPHPPLKKIEP